MRAVVLQVGLIATWLGCGVAARADSLGDALASAYMSNPQLEARRAQGRAVDEGVPQALSNWRPTVSFSTYGGRARYQANSGGPPRHVRNPRDWTLTLSQPLYRGGRTVAATKKAEESILAEREQLRGIEQTVLKDAATAYVDVLRDQAVLELNIKNEQVLQRQLEAAQDRFRVGEITRTDVAQAEARLAKAKADRIQGEGTLESTRAAYVKTVGAPPQNLESPKTLTGLPQSLEEAISLARAHNPTVRSADRTALAAIHNVDLVRGELLPTVSLDLTREKTWRTSAYNSFSDTASAFVKVSVPLYAQGSVYSRLREAKHTAGQRRLEVDDSLRKAVELASKSWEGVQTAAARIKSYESQIAAAEIALDGVIQETQAGSRTVLDVLNAQQELVDARVSLARARRDEIVAEFDLLASVGRMNAAGLGLAVKPYDPEEHAKDVRNIWFGGSDSADADALKAGDVDDWKE
ncbi:MAG: TolC family outer membrane protein [Alphaproteobacteria bacterium]|nr:TolC family outer membrane protein [Alphaproteobacteria bacterium]